MEWRDIHTDRQTDRPLYIKNIKKVKRQLTVRLAAVLCALVPILAIMGGAMGKIMTSVSKDELENYSTAGALAEEVLSALRTVIAFGGEERESARYNTEIRAARKNAFVRGAITALTMGLMFGVGGQRYSESGDLTGVCR